MKKKTKDIIFEKIEKKIPLLVMREGKDICISIYKGRKKKFFFSQIRNMIGNKTLP
jgi:hypothetical protein